MFRTMRRGTRYWCECEECGHVQFITKAQYMGEEVVECEECGMRGFVE